MRIANEYTFFIIDYKGEPVTKGEQEEDFCEKRKEEDIRCRECKFLSKDDILWNVYCLIRLPV